MSSLLVRYAKRVQPVMAVGTTNHIENSMTTRTTLGHCSYTSIDIGSGDVASLVLSFRNWYIASNNTVVDNANTVPIQECAVQYNGVSVPVYFAGSRSTTLPIGANDFQADTLLPAQFGVPFFPRGARLWVKLKVLQVNTAHTVPTSAKATSGGMQSFYYDPVATTMGSVDTLGQFGYSGAVPQSRVTVMSPWALGQFVEGDPIVRVHHGDSISQAINDTGLNLYGDGWFQRAVAQADNSLPVASMNFGVAGNSMTAAYADARIMAHYQYANRGSFMYGANDFGTTGTGTTLAVMQARVNTVIANMGKGSSRIKKIVGAYVLPRTTSTDLWATEVNQTLQAADWGAGGNTDLYNQWLLSLVGTSLSGVLSFPSIRGTDPKKWRTNGSARGFNQDEVHPLAAGHAVMAEDARSVFASIS